MNRSRSLILIIVASIGLAACASSRDPDIRDVRPLQVQRGDKVIVEAARPLFTVGAPTRVLLQDPSRKQPITTDARAVSPTRVLFDADDLERSVPAHLIGRFNVTVEQTVDKQPRAFQSSPNAPFELDLFPATLQKAAQALSDKLTGHPLWDWLGMDVKAGQGGVVISDVVAAFDRAKVLGLDQPPLDGKISKDEARAGGITDAQFDKLDHNHDGYIEDYELEAFPQVDGIAAAAGLKAGDVIVSANGHKVAGPVDLASVWDQEGAPEVKLDVLRAGQPMSIVLPLHGRPTDVPGWLIWALIMVLAAALIALPVPVIGGLIVVWERKISAYMQSRIGPNRVGPNGWLQWLADGLKLIMKEDLVPAEADPILFKLSPFLAFIGVFLVMMVLPFTQWIVVADLNIGLLFLLSVTSLVVVSIIMGGWSSNSKWSLLGGMRSAAQIISYELPASVALLGIATLTGSLSTESIVRAQGGWPWEWYLFHNPFTFAAFFIYFISALAEGNRTPFDLPEAESELVSGYNTEYSGFRFALFPLVEWVNLFIVGAVAGMLFCGGWNVPGLSYDTVAQHWQWGVPGFHLLVNGESWKWQLLGFLIYLAKIVFFIFVIIWIRWTLPRFRVDQMMNLCWKYFIPISFACFVGTLAFAWLLPNAAQMAVHVLMFLVGGVGPAWVFIQRVRYNRGRFRELRLNPML